MKSMASPHTNPNPPLIPLYRYQREWIADDTRFKLAVKSRQTGFTFGTTLRHVRKRIGKKGLTLWVSASERQSKEAVEYAKLHAEAAERKFAYDELEFDGIEAKALQLTFEHNGARLIAVPANPDTMRGFSGDVVLDEFAFHRDPKKIWKSAMAIASRGFQIEVISTPNGQSGNYWDLCKKAGVDPLGSMNKTRWTAGVWSIHWLDIHEAVRQGCPIDIVAMRSAADDEDTWLQEYCCVFLADAENYIPMDLVIACESEDATLVMAPDYRPQGDLFLGADIGRKKDRTVIWIDEKLGDVLWTRAVTVLERTPFKAQFEMIDSFMPSVRRACIDATGLGAQLAEDLQTKWGAGKVEAVQFNLQNKEQMAVATKKSFEERKCRIPSAAFIRRSINAVKRYTSPTGHFRFDADRTEAGHADEFWGKALANAAAAGPGISTDFVASTHSQAHVGAGGYAA
jgi:phage FluMu gp28-like protein